MSNKDKSRGWIGVDLDSTLAKYDEGQYPEIGEPIPKIVNAVKDLMSQGYRVKIVTARVHKWDQRRIELNYIKSLDCNRAVPIEVIANAESALRAEYEANVAAIDNWCQKHIGSVLPITSQKDFEMVELWDDRAVAIKPNEGSALQWIDGQAHNSGSWL